MDGWWAEIEREILESLRRHGTLDPARLGQHLGIGERAIVSLLAMLAVEGKVRICLVEAATLEGPRAPTPVPAPGLGSDGPRAGR
jgi:hypothetical protein